jgi:hypothetical protein
MLLFPKNTCLTGTLIAAQSFQGATLIAQAAEAGAVAQSLTLKATTNDFQFCELAEPGLRYDLLIHDFPGDTLYLGSATAGSGAPVRLTYPLKLRKNLLGHWVCPKCKRADETVEMVYGDGIPYDPASRKLPSGCINTGTRGYCRRDRVHF